MLSEIYLSEIKEGTFQLNTTGLFKPLDYDFMEDRYTKQLALHLPLSSTHPQETGPACAYCDSGKM